MKKKCLLLLPVFFVFSLALQGQEQVTDTDYLSKAVHFLASDNNKGRVNFSREQFSVARFLYNEFKQYGLKPFQGFNNYLVPFTVKGNTQEKNTELLWNGKRLKEDEYYFIPSQQKPRVIPLDSFYLIHVSGSIPDSIFMRYWDSNQPVLFKLDNQPDSVLQNVVNTMKVPVYPPKSDILITAVKDNPAKISLNFFGGYPLSPLYNIVGVLPGKSKSKEMVIFSAHYDHVDKGMDGEEGEIFNGANDDASGVAAVLALVKYYTSKADNERTIVFCLFAAEELGLVGSTAFSTIVDPTKVKAMISLEMLGMTNAVGKNAFFITGDLNSTLSSIFSHNLKGDKVKNKWYNDQSNLFARSDNYPFYMKGIPAHGIMCSDDKEPCYHKPCDDADRIDYLNMAEVIRAIVKGAGSIIAGTDTPVLRKF